MSDIATLENNPELYVRFKILKEEPLTNIDDSDEDVMEFEKQQDKSPSVSEFIPHDA